MLRSLIRRKPRELARLAFERLGARVRTVHVLARAARVRTPPWVLSRRNARCYRVLDETELRATKRSDTLFVFGSGASLNELTPEEIAHFEQHDTLGFNWFVRQSFVRTDYHLIRGIPDTDFDADVWKPQLREYFGLIRSNPLFDDTVFLVQSGFRATNGNRALGYRLLPEGSRVFRWRTIDAKKPSTSLRCGLAHGVSTLGESVNFGFVLGWRNVVLVGVDLYDRRYFWLPPDESRGVDARRSALADEVHSVARNGMIDVLADWARIFEQTGVRLSVYNPRSLLAEALPVYAGGRQLRR